MRTILVVFYATAAIVLSCLARVIVMGWYYPRPGRTALRLRDPSHRTGPPRGRRQAASVNEQQKAQAAELHDQGLGCSAIAKQVGVHPSTISRWAAKEGLDFDRTQTAVAVRSAVVSRASRRQQITDRIYSQIEALLDRMQYRPRRRLESTREGRERRRTIRHRRRAPHPRPARPRRKPERTPLRRLGLERSNAMFAQEETVESARSLLGSLAEALGVTNPDGSPVR